MADGMHRSSVQPSPSSVRRHMCGDGFLGDRHVYSGGICMRTHPDGAQCGSAVPDSRFLDPLLGWSMLGLLVTWGTAVGIALDLFGPGSWWVPTVGLVAVPVGLLGGSSIAFKRRFGRWL